MDGKIFDLISEKPIVIPKILLNNYRNLSITDFELIIIMVIISKGNKVVYNPIEIANEINVDKFKVMESISDLASKNIISLVVEKKNSKTKEYLTLDLLYKKLINIVMDIPSEEKVIDNSIFDIFESEIGKPLSPMQYEQIKEWLNRGISDEIVIEALKEAVINGTNNFRYIDTIINKWQEKGIKTKKDIEKEKVNYRNKKKETPIFDTDWINYE